MKRIVSLFLTLLVLLCSFSCMAFATNETVLSVEHFEDGSYGVVSMSKSIVLFAGRGSVTESKHYSYYDNNSNLDWRASITATFSYNGTSASCTDVSKSTTIYDSAWKCTSSSCSKSGATATGNFTFKRYVLLVPVQTVNKTLTLTCDANGNVS